MGFIYKITSPSNRVYVGKTIDLKKRMKVHKSAARTGKSFLLARSIRKYGWANHIMQVIEETSDDHILMNEREIFWIAKLETYCYENKMGLNQTRGGDGHRCSWKNNLERVATQSKRYSKDGNPFFGKKHTDENKKDMSDKARKRNLQTGKVIPEWGAEKGRNIVRRPIVCYGADGGLMGVYISLTDTSKKLNINISSVKDSLRFDTWVSGKYFFRYKDGEIKQKIEVPAVTEKTVKRPVLVLTPEYEVICEHESAKEASEFWGVPKTTINRAAMYNWLVPIRTGHVFIYTDLYEQILAAEQAA